jgi:type VI secretion system protein ImpK
MRCQEIRLTNVSNHNLDNLLSHEVKAFESQARKYGHHKTTILAARYCLCAYIDDQFRRYGLADYRANEHSFLQHYHQTTLDQEQTHLIVSRCQQHAYEFTELMELIYILYRIGFEGRSRQSIDDYKTLLSKTDQLFQQLKPSKPQTLYVQAPNEPQYCSESNQSSTRLWLNQSKLTAIATVSLCLIVIGAGLWLL